jgi:hypothetical protein
MLLVLHRLRVMKCFSVFVTRTAVGTNPFEQAFLDSHRVSRSQQMSLQSDQRATQVGFDDARARQTYWIETESAVPHRNGAMGFTQIMRKP